MLEHNNLALIYQDLGDLEQAKEYQQRVPKIIVYKLGSEHVDVPRRCNNLALIYKDLGDLAQAKEYQQRTLKIRLDKPGPEHVLQAFLDIGLPRGNRCERDS